MEHKTPSQPMSSDMLGLEVAIGIEIRAALGVIEKNIVLGGR